MDYKIVQIIPAPAGMYVREHRKDNTWGPDERVICLALTERLAGPSDDTWEADLVGLTEVRPLVARGGDIEALTPGDYLELWEA